MSSFWLFRIRSKLIFSSSALLCEKYGVDVIYLSNHGGRQLDGSPSALETLMEIKRFAPQILESTEIWLDGGIRRGTDVLKALALGATAVGIGRGCELIFDFRF